MNRSQGINMVWLVRTLLSVFLTIAAAGSASCGPRPTPRPTPIRISITAEPTKVFPGGSAKLVAVIDGTPVTPPNSCFWSARERGYESLDCETSYKVPKEIAPNTKITFIVDVTDGQGKRIGTGDIELPIVVPSDYYYLFIIDSSTRMSEPFNTGTRLDQAIAVLRTELACKLENANVGLRVFGYTETPAEICQNTELLVPVALGTKPVIEQKLSELSTIGEAPLYTAIYEGLNDLKPVTGNNYLLILVIGGSSSCETEDLPTFVKLLSYRVPESELVDFQVHLIGIRPSDEGSAALVDLRDELRTVIAPTFYYSATTPAELVSTLGNLSLLSSPMPLDRALGYDGLAQTLEAQGDLGGTQFMLDQQMELVPDLHQSLFRRGLNFMRQGEWQFASEDFTRVIDHWPSESTAYFFRGVTWFNQGDYGLAERDFATSVQLNPDFAMAEYARGFALIELDDPSFRDTFTKAYELDPTFFDKPYFAEMPSAYTQFEFYEEATPFQLKQTGELFFQGPIIFSFGEAQLWP